MPGQWVSCCGLWSEAVVLPRPSAWPSQARAVGCSARHLQTASGGKPLSRAHFREERVSGLGQTQAVVCWRVEEVLPRVCSGVLWVAWWPGWDAGARLDVSLA